MTAAIEIRITYDKKTNSYEVHTRTGQSEVFAQEETDLIAELQPEISGMIAQKLGDDYHHVPEKDISTLLTTPETIQ
ncbi:hypothetical protein I2492_05900 [Budviciaceae bacterium CWB-B4]|uniref:Uncharacterized protein n=1 Tax=Limnobaculum xujianqingii TaxID=2738837 RepID=A0A9D7FX35_9GAMM|nr:hypothetical protein [Limnobaculum xujianqingii]MBK5072542.1 hypothetical protein [Limnobaculum xujianqingii]MBK5175851.1 hypothetical protein [Limnobaculum xujianqingii]